VFAFILVFYFAVRMIRNDTLRCEGEEGGMRGMTHSDARERRRGTQ